MAEYADREFNGVTENLDGNSYVRCKFTDCRLIFRGGEIPRMPDCHFVSSQFIWEEAAWRTLEFLRSMRNSLGSGGKQLVEDVARQIRTPFPRQNS